MSQNKTVFPCVGPEVDYNLHRKLLDNKNTLTMIFKRFISSLMMSLIVVAALAENNYKETFSSPLNIREAAFPDANDRQFVKTVSTKETQSVQSNNTQTPEISDFESERRARVGEFSYDAGLFKEAKLSGSYGLSLTWLPRKIAPRLYAGIHFSPLNFNYGLNDVFDYYAIRLGPAIAYYFTPKIFISMPLSISCQIHIKDGKDDKTTTGWGMKLAPAIYLGNKAGVFFGPQFTFGFSGNSKVSCGFRTGIYFGWKK